MLNLLVLQTVARKKKTIREFGRWRMRQRLVRGWGGSVAGRREARVPMPCHAVATGLVVVRWPRAPSSWRWCTHARGSGEGRARSLSRHRGAVCVAGTVCPRLSVCPRLAIRPRYALWSGKQRDITQLSIRVTHDQYPSSAQTYTHSLPRLCPVKIHTTKTPRSLRRWRESSWDNNIFNINK